MATVNVSDVNIAVFSHPAGATSRPASAAEPRTSAPRLSPFTLALLLLSALVVVDAVRCWIALLRSPVEKTTPVAVVE